MLLTKVIGELFTVKEANEELTFCSHIIADIQESEPAVVHSTLLASFTNINHCCHLATQQHHA